MYLSNFDMLKIAAAYLNKAKDAIIHMDTSGKFLKPPGGKKLLNTGLVMPPPAPGHAPFPIIELISEQNKVVDYKILLELCWSYLSGAIGDNPVAYPKTAVTDLSFPNIHALLSFFNRVKLDEYLESCYKSFMKKVPIHQNTKVTICENHFTPAFLKAARASGPDKMVADSFVAGFLLVLRASTINEALEIWNHLVIIYGSKEETEEVKASMDLIKEKSKNITSNEESEYSYFCDFDEETTKEEEVFYGNRRLLRANSPFNKVFKKPAEKMKDAQKNIQHVSNLFYAPNLVDLMAKQYLPLYPLFSASVLENGIQTNSHIELYWKEQRRLIKNIPDRLLWPPYYLGNLHQSLRREAKSLLLHNRIPTIKYGGKIKPGQNFNFSDYVEDTVQSKDKDVFHPTPSKSQKRKRKPVESYDGCQEQWDSQRKGSQASKKKKYMKNKIIDFPYIKKIVDPPVQDIVVTGTVKGLGNQAHMTATAPHSIILTEEDINFITTPHLYLTTDAVDAGLGLLDRKLNEESNLTVAVYTTQNCRLIFNGDTSLVKPGLFVAILPRDFGITQESVRIEAMTAGRVASEPGSHFTLVSNLNCGQKEVNVYETFPPYKQPESLLTPNGKTLLKILCNSTSNVKVNCMNVKEQEESECGALAVALAVNLCFYAQSEETLFRRIIDVRKTFFDCMKNNSLTYFNMGPRDEINEESKVALSINI